MLSRLTVAALALTLAAPLGAEQALPVEDSPAERPLNAPDNADIVETNADRYRRLTVKVHIEQAGPFEFMVDTGSQATVVSRQLGEHLQLPSAGTGTVVGMASRREVPLVELDGLTFADRVFDNLTSPLLESDHLGADGILGLDSLQGLRVLIDFRADTIAVADADQLGGDGGYEIVVRARRKLGQLIITDATIDGVKTALIVDTGAQTSVGNFALRDRLRAKRGVEVSATDVNGVSIGGTLAVARKVQIDDLEITSLPIMYADSPAFAALGFTDRPALSLGMQDLRLFERVAIDFDRKRVLFDLPKSAIRRSRAL